MAPRLSKSRLIAYLQCRKRLWLQQHGPVLDSEDARAEHRFQIGNNVGDIAKLLYDPEREGVEIDAQSEGYAVALARSIRNLNSAAPMFEAGFATEDAVAFADIMLPVSDKGAQAWRMVEVKSATGIKDYYLDDAAIQATIARAAGVPLSSIAIAHINSDWVYPGGNDYDGLLVEADITAETFPRAKEQNTSIKMQLGPLLNGFTNYDFWLPVTKMDFPGVSDLMKKYQAKAADAKVDALGYYMAPQAYAQMQVLQQAVEATKSLDDNKLADYIRASTFKTVLGDVKFGKGGEWAESRVLQVQFQNIKGNDIAQFKDVSTQVVITPSDYASGKLVYPYEKAK